MSDLQNFMLVAEHSKEEALQIAATTAQKLDSKKITLIDVVQSLGEYITDEDATIRGKAVSYLTAVIKALPNRFLSRQQIYVLTSFYCDRIEDGGAIAGLDRLQSLERFNNEMAEMTVRTMFQHFQELRLRPQSQRYQILQLLHGLLSNHRQALRDMKDESLVGIVELVSGERDPRNLMVVFSVLRVLMVEWDMANHVQTLFDSVYNYFPITFKPPPNDPYGITAQDLKTRLQDCIASTQLFAPHAFPLLLDKLDSTSFNVKKDALSAITACITAYDPVVVSRYSISIWDSLKFEILNAQEEVLAQDSLCVLQAVTKRLSDLAPPNLQQSTLSQFLKPITNECNEQFREPQQKQAKPAQQILRSLSAASAASLTLITQTVVAPLLTVYQDADGIAKQRALLETLVSLLDSAIDVFGTWKNPNLDVITDNPFTLFQDKLVEIFSQSLMGTARGEVSFRAAALNGLLRLSMLRNILQDNEIGLVVQYLDEILLTETTTDRAELRKEAVRALAEISKCKPRLIIDISFPAFMATLPDSEPESEETYMNTLDCLAQISVEQDVFQTLVRRLLSKLDIILQPGALSKPAYPRAILLTILYSLTQKGLENDPHLDFYFDKIIIKLCRSVAMAAMEETPAIGLTDSSLLDTLGRLCNLIFRSLSREKQDEACKNVYGLFSTEEGFIPVPFSDKTTARQRQTMILSTYILAGLPKDSQLPYADPDMSALLHEIVRLAISEENPITQFALVRHAALLVNKFLPASGMPLAFDELSSLIPAHPPSTPGEVAITTELSPATIRTIFWLSKALILRMSPKTTEILTTLLSLLSSRDPVTSSTSARGFALLLSADDILSSTNGANIRLLYKQRVFTTVLPLISTHVRSLNSSNNNTSSSEPTPTTPPSVLLHIKQSYLTALSGILSTIPQSLVMPELRTLLPLLLQSLDLQPSSSSSDTDTSDAQIIKAATLETLAVIIRDNGARGLHEIGYIENIASWLIKTSTSTTQKPSNSLPSSTTTRVHVQKNSSRVRVKALQCLLFLAQTPISPSTADETTLAVEKARPSPLLPVKSAVLRALRFALDDPKRDVRKAAVDARAAWLRDVEDQDGDEED
ncbi:hypothetical protein AJ80_01571 [Polytolypa hystricis UAMH7299]|uniref:MMS19 nucleotide excision repair protein n=1 Tax=Polytolypa hystricis (strain UAMH7299) TaxID=1447883 RepID=A0A2B7YZN7_POLH7|nr:hypothetical protein AJ80_01571 [Polytolypa hystricis UAMH7299]